MAENTKLTKDSALFDTGDMKGLSNMALTGTMGGLGLGGTLGLIYMIAEAARDKDRAKEKQEEIKNLSPFLPTTAIATQHVSKSSSIKISFDLWDDLAGGASDFGRGAVMIPAAAGAVAIPAYLAYKFLKGQYDSSRGSQLERELESARDEFRSALSGTSKLSADIDTVIDMVKDSQNGSFTPGQTTPNPPPAKDTYDMIGGVPGMIGGGLSMAGLLAAYMTYKTMDNIKAKKNPKVRAIQAMKEMQQRRKALSEISPYVAIKQSPTGELYPSI
jgi:hypothetical protein